MGTKKINSSHGLYSFINQTTVLLLFSFIIIGFSSCLKDRDFPVPASTIGPGGNNDIEVGTIVINEIMAKEDQSYGNELNPAGGSDFFELFNTTNEAITLVSGKWYVTDDTATPEKYQLPFAITIPARGYYVIYADGLSATTGTSQIHTSFGFSSAGEACGLFYVKNSTTSFFVDQKTFGAATNDESYGRIPDGANNWVNMAIPTPGTSNHL